MSRKDEIEKNYTRVKVRKKLFFNDYPCGSIQAKLISPQEHIMKYVHIVATIKRNRYEDIIDSNGNALEIKGEGFVNTSSWLENCEESAIGRALDNLGYAGSDKPSKEEMEQAKRNKETVEKNKRLITEEEQEDLIQTIKEKTGKDATEETRKWAKTLTKNQLDAFVISLKNTAENNESN